MSEAFTMPPPEEAIDAETMERLRQAAEEAASWEVVPRPAARSYFPLRVHAARQALRSLEVDLARQPLPPHSNDPEATARRSALLEIGASYRLFRATISAVSSAPRRIAELPRLPLGARQDEPRIAGVARVYLEAVDGVFPQSPSAHLSKLCSHSNR